MKQTKKSLENEVNKLWQERVALEMDDAANEVFWQAYDKLLKDASKGNVNLEVVAPTEAVMSESSTLSEEIRAVLRKKGIKVNTDPNFNPRGIKHKLDSWLAFFVVTLIMMLFTYLLVILMGYEPGSAFWITILAGGATMAFLAVDGEVFR